MTLIAQCAALTDLRQNIDCRDRQLVALIAERAACVRQAAGFKKCVEEVATLHPPSPQLN